MARNLEDSTAYTFLANTQGQRRLGLPDAAFEQRKPLKGQITKREVRAVSLYSLGLRPDSIVWDIGAGTGSVAIEAAQIAYQGAIYAVERDQPSLPLLERNVARWGASNVQVMPGEAPEVLESLPDPDAVFIGGSGGRLLEILDAAGRRLQPGGSIVVNLAVLERTQDTYRQLKTLGLFTELTMVSAARGKEMADGTTRLDAQNPVFIVTARRGD